MATLDEVCTAIPTALSDLEVEFYAFVPDVANVPAIVVWPQEGEWVTMGRGFDRHELDLYVLTARAIADEGQAALRQLIHEVRAAVFANRSLGLASTDAHVLGYSRFGGSFDTAQVPHIGAVLRLVVQTPGT